MSLIKNLFILNFVCNLLFYLYMLKKFFFIFKFIDNNNGEIYGKNTVYIR